MADAPPTAVPPADLALEQALIAGALPGELLGFDVDDRAAAARLAEQALTARTPMCAGIAIETGTGSDGRRLMRLAVANDDMPFLVDSIAAVCAATDISIDRILHPVLDADGARISLIYMETERADAKRRSVLTTAIGTAIDDVRAAVSDWSSMQEALAQDASTQDDGEAAALLAWFYDGKLTLLGSAHYPASGAIERPLGIARTLGDTVLAPDQRIKARAWLDANGGAMLVKSNALSRVHRRAPLDLIVVPARDGVTIHAGLWTSAALSAAPDAIPVLRGRLSALMAKYGFVPDGHAGKALTHALTALPHDVLLAIDADALERLALTAMSLADRPRAELVLARDGLDRHVFAFVWLPRDELTTARRIAIATMLGDAADAALLSWSIDLGDGEVALIRYTFDRRMATRDADEAAVRTAIVAMVRGWAEAVEASLATANEAGRAARLALRYAEAFPAQYRAGAGPDEAALDIARLQLLSEPADRQVRLYRNADDARGRLRLKLYSLGAVMLSDVVPGLENFGFRVVEEMTTPIGGGTLGQIHRFVLDIGSGDADVLRARAEIVEGALRETLEGRAESDRFNALIVAADFGLREAILLRALFRYLRQTGLSYGLVTVVDALRRYPSLARAVIDLFAARHDPAVTEREAPTLAADAAIERGLADVTAIDDDRVLRLLRAVVRATLRTNFYLAEAEAIAFKFDSAKVPGLPAPVPWREIWVYSPRVEGIHLRAGPIARGGLRWSDRRDDFRTETLGLMKAQRVKNAVIVPTGAKGGFFPKLLPDPVTAREAWLIEGTEAYRLFIRTLLSITDNIVDGSVEHPAGIVIHDGPDPYFVVAADKGTATFSDVANALAAERGFWLGDAFASGGSVGYDHKAMGITAKGAWISVQRHFAELGTDVQTRAIRIVGCGDMSGDVFGNGLLLSKAVHLIAAFDHRHIFIDPSPDPATSWTERARLFALPRSSWADYDARLVSVGGGVWPRSAKSIELPKAAATALGLEPGAIEPGALISAILKAPVDLIWFGGIGTYVKAASETHGQVGDPGNDAVRVDAEAVHARAIGEGANLGVTQAARIAFALKGGRINTDFIDNSAGVDCSDHEVNIKIALATEVAAGKLTLEARNTLLAAMTDQVVALVLADNRLQTLALSIAERGGAATVPALLRLVETFEASGRLDRRVEGLPSNDILQRRAQDGHGLTRPELAILLATAKLALQDAIEAAPVATDPALVPELIAAFPEAMQVAHRDAIERHQLRGDIVATKLANRIVNRMGIFHPYELAEEEGASLGDVATAFVIAERLFDIASLWAAIDAAAINEGARLLLFDQVAVELRAAMADLLRGAVAGRSVGATLDALRPGIDQLTAQIEALLVDEARVQAQGFATRLRAAGVPDALVARVVRLAELDGAVGIAALAGRNAIDVEAVTRAFTMLGGALGLDWAQGAAMQAAPIDPWERLLVAGLGRDFQQMRLDFLRGDANGPEARVAAWLTAQAPRVADYRRLVDRARVTATPTPAMLAQLAGQARVLLARR